MAELPKNLAANPILSRWVEVGADGTIGVRVGKVELGQGIMTALAQIAADELGVDLAAIRMLPAGPDGPDEGITAGSMSIMDSGPAVRMAAANVRARFTAAAGEPTFSYADLAATVDLDVPADPEVPTVSGGALVGRDVPRLDLPDKVFGRPRYIQDMRLPGQLFGRVIRPPSPGARLRSADLGTAATDRGAPGATADVERGPGSPAGGIEANRIEANAEPANGGPGSPAGGIEANRIEADTEPANGIEVGRIEAARIEADTEPANGEPGSPAGSGIHIGAGQVAGGPGLPAGVTLVRDGSFLGVIGADEAVVVRAAEVVRTAARWDAGDTLPDENDLDKFLRAGPHELIDVVDDGEAAPPADRTLSATYSRPFIAHASMAPSCGIAVWTTQSAGVSTPSGAPGYGGGTAANGRATASNGGGTASDGGGIAANGGGTASDGGGIAGHGGDPTVESSTPTSDPGLEDGTAVGESGCVEGTAAGRVDVWSHSQGVFPLGRAIAAALDLDPAVVRVQHAESAGCYGHNAADDAAFDAVLLARAVPGRPVQVLWSRPDELTWAPFGSAMTADVTASLSGDGRLSSWRYDLYSQGHTARPGYAGVPGLLAATLLERPATYPAAVDPPAASGYGSMRNAMPGYDLPRRRITGHRLTQSPIRSSAMRALGAYLNVFAIESFMDEAADLAGQDPLAFRMRHLSDPRGRRVLSAAAEAGGWGQPLPESAGRGIGYARYKGRGAYCAVVAEVEAETEIRVRRLTIAVDVGEVVNPDGVRNQIEGGAVQSASWTLTERVRFDRRRITSDTWESYPILRFTQTPSVEVTIVGGGGGEKSLGAGEAAQGPTAAAIGNAVAMAVGVRVRDLPLTTEAVVAAIERAG